MKKINMQYNLNIVIKIFKKLLTKKYMLRYTLKCLEYDVQKIRVGR